jgi:hypothetical protein
MDIKGIPYDHDTTEIIERFPEGRFSDLNWVSTMKIDT